MINELSYIGYFFLILAMLNSFLLISSKTILYKININTAGLISLTSRMHFPILLLSFLCLIYSFLIDDFSVKYISDNSNSALPYFYKVSAVWAGHEGSMLLWCLILSFWMFLVSKSSESLDKEFRENFLSIMGFLNFGFLLFLIFTSDPFEKNLSVPIDGRDLNPLLQDFGLIVHPPMLYMGYVGLSVVFSFAVTCCIHKEFKKEWATWLRPWLLLSWSFLTLGIALGSWWAYYELGWGGWWFWDPVENASFMPWLMSTALVHSLIMTEQKNIFKNWTILLAIFAFSLSLLGTFLVRSGILVSVHSFANDPTRGIFILIFLGLIIGVSLLLYSLNADKIKDNQSFDLISKESFFLINNILLVTATFTVLLGTIYPLILDIFGLEKISVGTPYYNLTFLPIMIPLIILAGVIPTLRFDNNSNLKNIAINFIFIALTSLVFILIFSIINLYVMLGLFLFFWITINLFIHLFKNLSWMHIGNRFKQNIGMYFAHIGLAIFTLGATIVESNKIEKELIMKTGDTIKVNKYTFEFEKFFREDGPNYESLKGKFNVFKDGKLISVLNPEKRLYFSNQSGMPMTEAGIQPGLSRDLYVSLGNLVDDNSWSVRIYYKPLVRLVWLGALIMVLGALLSIYFQINRNKKRRTT
ncbi:MAG: heme lyase NrfEFG subunit NrfE [Gammaproteobacteria bacterium]|nr:heme lyase NrfEFG subunit NrfE [Gammaproteobacteria bacterium]|tara:strand:+ start:177706 stop:179634 length:1929 start_codon:yes stop_codon:yes gene_type:complete